VKRVLQVLLTLRNTLIKKRVAIKLFITNVLFFRVAEKRKRIINMKDNKVWEICFALTIIVTLLLIILGREILSTFGITTENVDSTIGGYIASLIGAMIGAFLAVFSAGFVDNKNEKKKIRKEQMNNARLLTCDLKTMLRIMQNNYAVTSFSAYMKEYKRSSFYSLLEGISERYDLNSKKKYEYLLSSERRAEIITEADENVFLKQNQKEQLLSFISGYILPEDDLSYSSQITHRINVLLSDCSISYKSVENFLEEFHKQQDVFDSPKIGVYDEPLLAEYSEQISSYILSFLQQFLLFGQFSQAITKAVTYNFSLDFWMEKEEFNQRLLSRDRDNLSNAIEEEISNIQDGEKSISEIYDCFCKYLDDSKGKQQFEQAVSNYRSSLFEKIKLDENFDEGLKHIQEDYKSTIILNSISNREKEKKLNKLYDLISLSFKEQLLCNDSEEQIVIPYGRSKYFGETNAISDWLSFRIVDEFADIKSIMKYKQDYYQLKYSYIPKLRNLLGATNWEYGVPTEIVRIIENLEKAKYE
jgi:hypothetical protein